MRMDQITENLPGVIAIHDDITVFGKNQADHDECLHRLMHRAVEKGLVFNSKKCAIAQDQIDFFGGFGLHLTVFSPM